MIRVEASLPDDVVDVIVERVAAIVLDRLRDERARDESEFVTVSEAAEILRAKPQRVYDLVSEGQLTRHKDGSRLLVSRAELVSYLSAAGRGSHLSPSRSRSRMTTGVAR